MEVLFDPHPIPPSDEGGRVKKGEKMKTEKETKQDDLAAIGIGAFLLVFLPGYFFLLPSGSEVPEMVAPADEESES